MIAIHARDQKHLDRYNDLIKRDHTEQHDCYRIAMFYLIALNDELYNHVHEYYKFERHQLDFYKSEDSEEYKDQPWQTGTSQRVYKLALNLFNGFNFSDVCVDQIFNYGEYDIEYYLNAIRLRYVNGASVSGTDK